MFSMVAEAQGFADTKAEIVPRAVAQLPAATDPTAQRALVAHRDRRARRSQTRAIHAGSLVAR